MSWVTIVTDGGDLAARAARSEQAYRIEQARLEAIARHPEQALCINCTWPIGEHSELPELWRGVAIAVQARICPTSVFKTTVDAIAAASAEAIAEYRAEKSLKERIERVCNEFNKTGTLNPDSGARRLWRNILRELDR